LKYVEWDKKKDKNRESFGNRYFIFIRSRHYLMPFRKDYYILIHEIYTRFQERKINKFNEYLGRKKKRLVNNEFFFFF
jgi:hypothetical protein